MKVFVTGGSGFFGRQIVKAAKEAGHEVFAPRSSECNLMELDSVTSWFKKQADEGNAIDVVISSAAYYGGLEITMSEPATILFNNLRMINNLFEASKIAEVKKTISIGSACSYPGGIAGDMSEDDFWSGPLHESVEGYGFTKKIQLVAQGAMHKQHGIEGNHLVITNLYGPNDVFHEYRGHAIAVLIKRYVDAALENRDEISNWGDGSAIREFIFVEDAAKVVAGFIDAKHDLKPVNVGTGIGTSIKELAELLTEYSGYKGKVTWDTTKPNGVQRKVLDVSRMNEFLPDFKPLPFADGLKKTVEWYRSNKEEADKRR